jgi:hypothetical protein
MNTLKLIIIIGEKRKKGIKKSHLTTVTLRLLLTNSQCGVLLGLGGEKKREVDRDTCVSLIVSNFFVEKYYRTVIVSGKCFRISLLIQFLLNLQKFM